MVDLPYIYLRVTLKEVKLIKHFFINTKWKDILVVQVYANDIMFGATNDFMQGIRLCEKNLK